MYLSAINMKRAGLVFLTMVCVLPVVAEEFNGTLLWSARVEISTPVSGVIEEIYANSGDRVEKGAKLLKLDDTVFRAKVKSSKAVLQNRIAEYKEASRELERMQELYDRTMLSEHDLQIAKNSLVSARAKRERAATDLAHAQQNLKYSSVQAPFDAIILQRMAQPGQVIAASLKPETLFVVAESRRMLARIMVSEQWLDSLQKGRAAKIFLDSDAYNGKVMAVGMEPVAGSSGNASYPVDVEFAITKKLYRAGQQVKVVIP